MREEFFSVVSITEEEDDFLKRKKKIVLVEGEINAKRKLSKKKRSKDSVIGFFQISILKLKNYNFILTNKISKGLYFT